MGGLGRWAWLAPYGWLPPYVLYGSLLMFCRVEARLMKFFFSKNMRWQRKHSRLQNTPKHSNSPMIQNTKVELVAVMYALQNTPVLQNTPKNGEEGRKGRKLNILVLY